MQLEMFEMFIQLTQVYEELVPLQTAVEMLGSRDMTLLSADATLKFLVTKLSSTNSSIADKLFNALRRRIAYCCCEIFAQRIRT